MRPDPVRVSGWRVFIRDLLSLSPRGRLFIRLFYNVISTGVRTIVRTQRRNPPRERYLFVYTSSVFPSGRLPRRFAPRNDSGVKGVRLVCYPCALVLVSFAGDFSAVSHRGRAGWRVYVTCSFFRRGFLNLGCAFARNDKTGYLFARVTAGREAHRPTET